MASLSKVEFKSKFYDLFADNIIRAIDAEDLRVLVDDLIDSFYNTIDSSFPSASFSSISGSATDNSSINALAGNIINTVRGGVDTDYNTLKKLYDWTVAQLALKQDIGMDGGTP